MSLTNIISFVSKIAPLLGSALGGPPGLVASMALSLVAKAFGADESNPDDLLAKIQSDPDAAIKLKQIEEQHFKDEISDRDSARKFDETPSSSLNPMVPFLIILLVCGISGIIYSLISCNIASDIKTVLVMVLTALVREIPAIYTLFFGGNDDNNNSNNN